MGNSVFGMDGSSYCKYFQRGISNFAYYCNDGGDNSNEIIREGSVKILCSVDNVPCGDGASGPCMAQHPDGCTAKYIQVATKTVRKPKRQREEQYDEEEQEEWKL